MKPNKIDYFECGEDSEFIQNGCRDEKMKLFMDFLIKTDVEFKIGNLDGARFIKLNNEIGCIFYDTGGIKFIKEEATENENP